MFRHLITISERKGGRSLHLNLQPFVNKDASEVLTTFGTDFILESSCTTFASKQIDVNKCKSCRALMNCLLKDF